MTTTKGLWTLQLMWFSKKFSKIYSK